VNPREREYSPAKKLKEDFSKLRKIWEEWPIFSKIGSMSTLFLFFSTTFFPHIYPKGSILNPYLHDAVGYAIRICIVNNLPLCIGCLLDYLTSTK
jgi:hypothetical protein